MEEEKKRPSTTQIVKEIKRQTRRRFTAEEKIKIVLKALRGEETITAICRKDARSVRGLTFKNNEIIKT